MVVGPSRMTAASAGVPVLATSPVTTITSGPYSWHGGALSPLKSIAIVAIGSNVVPPQEGTQPIHWG